MNGPAAPLPGRSPSDRNPNDHPEDSRRAASLSVDVAPGIGIDRRGQCTPPAQGPRRRAPDIVRSCREESGLSLAEMAERLGVPEQIVALWEDPSYDGIDLAILHRTARAAGGHIQIRFVAGEDS